MASLLEIFKYIARTIWILVNNLYCIPVYMVYITLLCPVYFVSPRLFNQVEQVLFSWLLAMVACWTSTAGFQVAESGVSLDSISNNRMLLMANHQSTADVPMMMTIFSSRIGFCNKVMWIMDRVFKFTNFGIVSWIHDDFFILAGKANRDSSLEKLRDHLTKVFLPKERRYLVLFPEGGFLRKRKEVSNEFAKKRDLPMLEHCTLPRTGALDVILNCLGPQEGEYIEKLVDVTLAYPSGDPLDLQSIATGWREPCTTHVHYRVFDSSELACLTSEERFAWMVKLYQEKDEMLARFYETGEFPYNMFDPEAKPPKLICHDPLRFILLHVFFLVSNYVVYCYFIWISAFLFP